jgi:hypothetical protein
MFRDENLFDKQQKEIQLLMDLDKDNYIDLYFGDESHFGLTPNVPYAWQHKNTPTLLPAKKSRKLTVFGLMNLDGKLYSKMNIGSLKSLELICYLDEFAQTITKRTVIVLDNAPIHRSRVFKEKIKLWESLDMYIYFLPPYSPELNKIEILWRFIKYKWLPFDAFLNFQNLKERLNLILNNMGTKYIINYY